VLAALAVSALAPAAPAAGATFTVASLGDAADAAPGNGTCKTVGNTCTLRAAVQEAEATPAADTIAFSVNGTITLGTSLPVVTRPLTVDGPGAALLSVRSDGDGCSGRCHLTVAGGTTTLRGLTLSGARLNGALAVWTGARLVLDRIALVDNRTTDSGGAVSNEGGELVARRTLFERNRADRIGSAIFATGEASTRLEDSALVANEGGGAAVHSQVARDFTAINTTWSGNRTAPGGGGGALLSTGSPTSVTTLTHVTITGTRSPDGGVPFLIYTPSASIRNSLVAGNLTLDGSPGIDCHLAAHSQGGNVWGRVCDQSVPASDRWGDPSLDPLLGPLADNGGPTPTHRLLPGSPAIDHALGAFCPGMDQRGRPRLTDGDGNGVAACDAGAYELPALPGPCVANDTTLCLHGGRFRVTVAWRTGDGAGPGHVVPGASTDSGLLWFFHPANWEMLVKVLDGCGLGGHWWVFFAATTNVEYTLRVEDTATGELREYTNPAGRLSPTVADTGAFACP
jgi:CSLREA domain-containing protein